MAATTFPAADSWTAKAGGAPGALNARGYGAAPGNDGSDEPRDRLANQEHMSMLVLGLRALPHPVIAAVNGSAAGLGFALRRYRRFSPYTCSPNIASAREAAIRKDRADVAVELDLGRLRRHGRRPADEISIPGYQSPTVFATRSVPR